MRCFPIMPSAVLPRAILLTVSLLSGCAAADSSGVQVGPGGRAAASSSVYGNFLAGRFALNHGDFDAAANDLLMALAATPNDPDLLQQAFTASVNAGRPEAVQLARRLPSNQVGQMILANDAAKSGNWGQAIARFQGLPRDGFMQLLQPLLLAWAWHGAGNPEQASVTLRPFIDNSRFRAVVVLHAALIADLSGRAREAASLFQLAASDLSGQGPRTAMIVASWMSRTGRTEEGAALLRQMAAASPEASIALPGMIALLGKRQVNTALDGLAEIYSTFGAALRTPETNDFAMVMTRLALDVKPDFPAVRLLAADIQVAARHPDAALGLLESAMRTSDYIAPIIRLRRATLLEQIGRSDEAIREVERVGRDYPDSSLPDIALADLLRSKRRFAEAIVAYDRVIAGIRQPTANDWIVYYGRGIAYERTGQWSRAETDFQHALTLSPDQPSVLNYLGYAWADMGRNLERAYALVQRAAARRPNDGAITDSLGWVRYRQGHFQDAMKFLEKAVGLEPEDGTITDHLGDVYWAVGRRIEAHYQWRRALTLKIVPEDAAKIEAKIKSHPNGAMASEK